MHDPFGLVTKHCEMISLTWPHTNEQWESEIPFENERDSKDVQTRLKYLYFVSYYGMTLDDQMEVIKKNLAKVERGRKEE
jgi:hypothetical protein